MIGVFNLLTGWNVEGRKIGGKYELPELPDQDERQSSDWLIAKLLF